MNRRLTQVAEYIGQGLSNKEIASRLDVAHQTAKGYVYVVMQKTGKHRLEIIAEYQRALAEAKYVE